MEKLGDMHNEVEKKNVANTNNTVLELKIRKSAAKDHQQSMV